MPVCGNLDYRLTRHVDSVTNVFFEMNWLNLLTFRKEKGYSFSQTEVSQ